jgi:aminoglycoside phosphotransferase family enzyme
VPANAQEVEFYRVVAAEMHDPPLARCYDAVYAFETGSYHLLLEDLSETHYVTASHLPPTREDAEHMVDALADFHAFWWDHPLLGTEIGQLPSEYDIRRTIGHAACYFPQVADFLADRLSSRWRRAFEQAFSAHAELLSKRLARGKHLTIVHGDAHAMNFLLPRNPARERAVIIDWYSPHWVWRCWTGVSDLAYLMVRLWPPERRRSLERLLLSRYHDRLAAHGVHEYSWDELWYDYRLSAMLSLYVIVEEAVRVETWKWYAQLQNTLAAFEDLSCTTVLAGRG